MYDILFLSAGSRMSSTFPTLPSFVVEAMRGFTVLLAAALLLLLVSLEAADTSTISYEEETRRMFVDWKANYGKTYKDVGEEECRYAVFKDTRRRVVQHNAAADAGEISYRLGLNQFGDIIHGEVWRGRGVRGVEWESYEEETRRMFVEWKAKYGKTYKDSGEEKCRYLLFKSNRRVIVQLNAAAGEISSYGLNRFGDLTNDEVRARCYGRGILGNLEMEGKLSARCQAAFLDLPKAKGFHLPWVQLNLYQVCRCIALELKQNMEVAPFPEMKHMWI